MCVCVRDSLCRCGGTPLPCKAEEFMSVCLGCIAHWVLGGGGSVPEEGGQ